MKRNACLILGLMIVLGNVVSADEDELTRSISVTGTVETKIAPDRIVWDIDLTDTDKIMTEAKARSDEKVRAVVALREKLGVAEGDLETGRVRIRREYERDQHGNRNAFKHFVVSRSVKIRQRDLKRFDEFLDTLVASAEMEVNFRYESSRMHEVRAETRLKALRAAQKKATDMADIVGAQLGPVLTINEHAQGGRWQGGYISNNSYPTHSPPSVDLATETFVPGAITVKMTVYATFELK